MGLVLKSLPFDSPAFSALSNALALLQPSSPVEPVLQNTEMQFTLLDNSIHENSSSTPHKFGSEKLQAVHVLEKPTVASSTHVGKCKSGNPTPP